MSRSNKYSQMGFEKEGLFNKRHELRKLYKKNVEKREGKNIELNVDLFGDYNHASWGSLTEFGSLYFIDIYSRVLPQTYLTYIINHHFNKSLLITAKIVLREEIDVKVRIEPISNNRSLITVLADNNQTLYIHEAIDVYLSISFDKSIKNNIDKKLNNSPALPPPIEVVIVVPPIPIPDPLPIPVILDPIIGGDFCRGNSGFSK